MVKLKIQISGLSIGFCCSRIYDKHVGTILLRKVRIVTVVLLMSAMNWIRAVTLSLAS